MPPRRDQPECFPHGDFVPALAKSAPCRCGSRRTRRSSTKPDRAAANSSNCSSPFLLTALIGLEREIQGKSAGLRTQAIVGTSAALIVLISKYGFGDVLTVGTIVLDPSRVAAQVVSGIGFLGGRSDHHAAWCRARADHCRRDLGVRRDRHGGRLGPTAARRRGDGPSLRHHSRLRSPGPLVWRLTKRLSGTIRLTVTYQDERGVLRQILCACERHGWQVTSVVTERASGGAAAPPAPGDVAVAMTVSGRGVLRATGMLATVDGVSSVQQLDDDDTE
jgi:putative Mg2+ transporter-C (MgtC) family protein